MFRILLAATEGSAISPSADHAPTWVIFITSAVVAAIVSAIVSLIGHRVARENAKLAADITRQNAILAASLETTKKLSDSRQTWINHLREDMAEFVSLATNRNRAELLGVPPADDEFQKFTMVSARIQLRMNPNDPDYLKLLETMARCSNLQEPRDVGMAAREFVVTSQAILKREWDVLKTELKAINQLHG